FIDAPPPYPTRPKSARQPNISLAIWDLFNDTFPGGNVAPATAAFDTTVGLIKTGYNTAPLTGTAFRCNRPGDSLIAWSPGYGVRLDLVFRILPGVGNYVVTGSKVSGVARLPNVAPRIAATPADASNGALNPTAKFWGAYMADNGAFGTGGNGITGPGHP